MSTLVKELLNEFIEQKKWAALRQRLRNVPEPELAEFLREADKLDRVFVFRCLSRDQSAEVFSFLEPEEQDLLLRQLTDYETRQLLVNLPPDDRTALLEELPAPVTKRLLRLLNHEDLSEARQLLGYPEESVGRLMTPDYVAVSSDWRVGEALDHVRKNGLDSETINMVYVTDNGGVLLDDIRLRRLILAAPEAPVDSVMDRTFASLSAFDDREEAVRKMQTYDLIALPVVDSHGVLLGIVTVDDVMDVAEEEATEDMQKSASVSPLKMSYHRAGVFTLYRKRAGWLVMLVILNLTSAGVIAMYEEKLAEAIVLLFFIPILIGSGGNAGAQAATLMIRALVTGDVRPREWAQTMLKELGVGLTLGVSLGLLGGFLGLLRGGFSTDIAFAVGLSMCVIVVLGNMVGMILPFLLERFKVDPAVASGPLITTIADASGLLVYFKISTFFIG